MTQPQLLPVLTEAFIRMRPVSLLARLYEADLQQLHDVIHTHGEHFFRGQLELALARPADRPELLPTRIHLARLEEHYSILSNQLDHAEARCRRLRSEGANDDQLFRAEVFANRLEVQVQRNLKELRKGYLELQKTLASSPESKPIVAPADVAQSIDPSSPSSPEASSSKSNPTSTQDREVATATSSQPPPQTSVTSMKKESEAHVASHQEQPESTPPAESTAMTARLVVGQQSQQNQVAKKILHPSSPSPTQNGKHAA